MRIIIQPPNNSSEGFAALSREIRKAIEVLRARVYSDRRRRHRRHRWQRIRRASSYGMTTTPLGR